MAPAVRCHSDSDGIQRRLLEASLEHSGEPCEVYRVEAVGMITSNYFAPGHRLRIHVAGSNFPLYERNLQAGGRNYDETQGRSATLQIHHDSGRASYIEVPTTIS